MEFAAKNEKSGSNICSENQAIEDKNHSLAKDRISDILRSSDYESSAKSAADEAVNSPASSSGTLTNNQPISQKSHIRDILTTPSAISVPSKTLGNFENKFGSDFSSVNFYQDERSTSSVNAKAYTYGTDIVFSPKHYKPDTAAGNKLIAHELAHVVQQNNSGVLQLQRDEAPQEIPEGKLAEYNDSLNEIMRRRTVKIDGKEKEISTGLLNHIYVVSVLVDTFKDESIIASLTRSIAADPDAKALSRKHGLSAIMALYDTNIDAKKAEKLLKTNKSYYSSDAIYKRSKQKPADIIKQDLLTVSSDSKKSAKTEASYSNIDKSEIEANWALTLSKENLASLKDSVEKLKMVRTHGEHGENRFKASKASLDEAEEKMDKCKKSYRRAVAKKYGDSTAMYMIKKIINSLSQARNSLGLASSYGISNLESPYSSIKVEMDNLYAIFSQWKQHKDKQKDSNSTYKPIYDLDASDFDNIQTRIEKINRKFRDENYKYKGGGKSVERIEFIIRYFIMLNDSSYTNGPTLEESKGFLNTLYKLPDDFNNVFGGISGFNNTVYIELIKIIPKQVKARTLLEKKSGKDPGIKINKTSIEEHFKALKKQPNAALEEAYEAYAGGFFQHRIEAPKERENPPTIDEIYKNPVTIGGARMIVCAGYAELGMHLYKLAGAKPKGFLSWGEFTEAEILADDPVMTDLHIVAKVRRKKENIYISNDEVYPTSEAAFNSVGFEKNPTNGKYSIKASGKTAKSSGKNFVKAFEKKKKELKKKKRK